MYKLIAMDFDGTLLTDDKKVLKETKDKLLKLKKDGYYIVGVTARTLESAIDVVSKDIFNYLILNNGTYLYDVNKKNGKYIGIIPKEEAQSIIDLTEEKSTQIDLVSGAVYYIYKNKKNSPLSFIIDINSLEDINDKIVRMNIFLEKQEDVDYLYNLICNNFSNLNTQIMQDSDSIRKWIIINPFGIDKSITLENLGKSLDITLDEMIFFGDGLNDLEVIKKVGCSVAMKNALEPIKQNAKFITDSNNENGIVTFLNKHLIKKY